MKYLLNSNKFFENISSVDDGLLIVQCLGFLSTKVNPQDDMFYKDPTNKMNLKQFHQNLELNKESIDILKGMLNGIDPDQSQIQKVQPVVNYISFLNDKTKKDATIKIELDKFVKECDKTLKIKAPTPQKFQFGNLVKKYLNR
jgi:hypothetical protein